jgi:WXG100 family type VII secretion target
MSNATEFGQGEGTLSKASGLVTDARADFNKIADRLSGQIAAVQGKWGGSGATAFFTLHTAWNEKQKVIVDALDEFAASLTSTEKDNVSTDDQQNASYTNLQGRLG